MLWAGFNDLGQRVVTWNKQEQRANVCQVLHELGLKGGERVLDFGCGTGLFATALAGSGLTYLGYDVDQRLVRYGSWLYPSLQFTSDKAEVVNHGPYDYILANCCFHHIPDAQIQTELEFIRRNLTPTGYFVLVDLLAPGEKPPMLQRALGILERGSHVRTHEDHVSLVQSQFSVVRAQIVRTHFLSMRRSRFHSFLGVYVGGPAGSVDTVGGVRDDG